MNFSEKLQILRKSKGYTQEELAQKLNVSRQAVAKWEAGQTYPDIINLIQISELMNITVDYLVKDNDCSINLNNKNDNNTARLIEFRLEAIANTYTAVMNQVNSSRMDSHDYKYEKGNYVYYDTYVGGEKFAGEEAIWENGIATYAMNYMGRVLDERFSISFLKEALKNATIDMPYRGPKFYQAGEYIYQAKVTGYIQWFQGLEEIYYENTLVYECYFHGGLVK